MKIGICFLLSLILFMGCKKEDEWEDIRDKVSVSIDLSHQVQGNTIYLKANITNEIFCSVSIEKYSFKKASYSVSDLTGLITDQMNESFTVLSDEGQRTLTCKVYIEGDPKNAEHQENGILVEERSWNLVFVDEKTLPSLLTHSVTADGSLLLKWQEPSFSHLKVLSYKLMKVIDGEFTGIPFTKDEFQYLDNEYFGQDASYWLQAVLEYDENTHLEWWRLGEVNLRDEAHLYISYSDEEKTVVSWKQPYKSHIKVSIDGQKPFVPDEGQTSVIIGSAVFGSSYKYQPSVTAYFAPLNEPDNFSVKKTIRLESPGIYLERDFGVKWHYNPQTNYMYSFDQFLNYVNLYSMPEMVLKEKYQPPGSILSYATVLSSPISATFVLKADRIYIADAKDLSFINIIDTDLTYCYDFCITNKDDLTLFYSEGLVSKMIVYEMNGKKLKEIDLTGYNAELSFDGKYLITFDWDNIYIMELSDYEVVNKKKYSHTQALFLPFTHDLLVYSSNGIEIRRASDFTIVRTLQLESGESFLSIDPETGNILTKIPVNENYYYLRVLSSTDGEGVLKIRAVNDDSISFQLVNNILISSGSYVLNISDYNHSKE